MKTILFVFLLVSLVSLAGSLIGPTAYKKLHPEADAKTYRKLLIYQPAAALICMAVLAASIIGLGNSRYDSVSADQADSVVTDNNQTGGYDQYSVLKVEKGNSADVDLNNTPATVKLIGVETFQSADSQQNSCYEKQSNDKLNHYLKGKKVELESDDALIDKSDDNALLRYVRIGDDNINESMIASGYARVSPGIANYQYRADFLKVQSEAKKQSLGLWSGKICKKQPPVHKPIKAGSTPRTSPYIHKENHRKIERHEDNHYDNSNDSNDTNRNNLQSCKNPPIVGPLLNIIWPAC